MDRRPVITLTSDFGLRDSYVAEMKGALLRACPDAQIVDVTHEIVPQDIVAAALALERALRAFAKGTIHVAVVDPGVGTDRRILLVRLAGQTVVCPDNGLITWAWRRMGIGKAYELRWRPDRYSATFHGRDVMAPAAAMLARGRKLNALAKPISDPVLLKMRPAAGPLRQGRVVHIDHFGNAVTDVPAELARSRVVRQVTVAGCRLGPIRAAYGDVAPGKSLALIGSASLVEIAVRNGSAARKLGLRVGARVLFE